MYTTDPNEARRSPVDPATGMQEKYLVLSEEERAKGFVRPVRDQYVHEVCGAVTWMALPFAETYARDPSFYNGTYCAGCQGHFPVGPEGEFVWVSPREGTPLGEADRVGT